MKAITQAAQSIINGDSEVAIAGGMESMTNVPFMLSADVRQGWRLVVHHASPGTPREVQELVESNAVLH